MIGSALKKLARENGMKIDRGVGYGSLRGYAATLSEGSGYKQIVFSTVFADPAKRMALIDLAAGMDLKKQFRVQKLEITPQAIQIIFLDNPGTMKKIYAFLDWFVPLLQQYEASLADVCVECGCQVTGGRWVLVNGIAYYMHDACAQKVSREINEKRERRAEEDNGSYMLGLLGALLGAALGAVVWALVLMAGYLASLVGLLIGWLAEKGYTLLRGKKGKGKILILIVAVIFGVLLGTFGAETLTMVGMIADGELRGYTMADIPFLFGLLMRDSNYIGVVMGNAGMGLLFAALGVAALLHQAGKEVAGDKFIELK